MTSGTQRLAPLPASSHTQTQRPSAEDGGEPPKRGRRQSGRACNWGLLRSGPQARKTVTHVSCPNVTHVPGAHGIPRGASSYPARIWRLWRFWRLNPSGSNAVPCRSGREPVHGRTEGRVGDGEAAADGGGDVA